MLSPAAKLSLTILNCRETATAAMEVFGQIIAEILQTGMPVTNKAIITTLIYRLELESDVVQLDIYRHLLELVVNKTPDDLSA